MGLRIIEPPATEPVSVAELKTQLRIDHAAEDGLLQRLITAGREAVEAYCGRALIVRRQAQILDGWPKGGSAAISLAWAPVREIVSVAIIHHDGAVVLAPASDYGVAIDADAARIWLRGAIPAAGRALGGLEVDYRVGYGAAPAEVPAALRQAVLATAAALYARGEGAEAFPAAARTLARAFIRVRT